MRNSVHILMVFRVCRAAQMFPGTARAHQGRQIHSRAAESMPRQPTEHMRWDTKLRTLNYLFLKVISFFHAQVYGWHFTVNHTFAMILDARETPAQRRYNAYKIIQNPSASSEL